MLVELLAAGGYFCEISEEKCVSCEYSRPICYDEFRTESNETWDILTVSVGSELSLDEYNCLSNSYCDYQDDDGIVGNNAPCPYWESSDIKHSFDAGTIIVLIFVGLVLAFNIYKDINQVTIEEVFFNSIIGKRERRDMFPASLLKISLYMRRLYLP